MKKRPDQTREENWNEIQESQKTGEQRQEIGKIKGRYNMKWITSYRVSHSMTKNYMPPSILSSVATHNALVILFVLLGDKEGCQRAPRHPREG